MKQIHTEVPYYSATAQVDIAQIVRPEWFAAYKICMLVILWFTGFYSFSMSLNEFNRENHLHKLKKKKLYKLQMQD